MAMLGFSMHHTSKVAREQAERDRQERAERGESQTENGAKESNATAKAQTKDTPDSPTAPPAAQAEESSLETDKFKLTLTNRGAGVKNAQLLDYNRKLNSHGNFVTINETRDLPVGAFSSEPNRIDETLWTIKDQSEKSVTYTNLTKDGLRVEKTFRLPQNPQDKPYELELEISIRNDSEANLELSDSSVRFLYAGGAAPLHFNEWSMQIGLYYREDGSTFRTKTVDYFGGKGKLLGIFGRNEKPYAVLPGIEKTADNVAYAGVNDQFFTTLIHAREPSDGQIWANKYPVVIDGDKAASERKKMRGCELAMSLPNLAMAPGDQKTLLYDIYMGPKEPAILKKAEGGRHLVMNYSQIPIFGKILGWAISPLASILSWGMVAIKGVVGNYGLAIIILTIVIRVLMWPVYAKSARSMKRMSKLSPLMKDLKEKYPDDPGKVQSETMKLYREYNISPVGGCLPMFLQIPVFLGFYRMLWGSVELRHESFLGFVNDLTMPDHFATIPGLDFPIHLLPILMSVASFVQMAMTPKTGDNTQRMIFMMMPFLFLVICYNFASGLALYWTVSNVFTIFQTWLMNKLPEPELKKSDKPKKGKKGFFERLQEQVEAAQAQQQQQPNKKKKGPGAAKKSAPKKKTGSSKKKKGPSMPQPGQSRTKLSSEKGSRHTKSKKKRR